MQREQYDMLQAQQQSIDNLKQMITLLLKRKPKTPKTKASSRKDKGKEKEGKNCISKGLKVKTTPILNPQSLHLKRREVQKIGIITPKG